MKKLLLILLIIPSFAQAQFKTYDYPSFKQIIVRLDASVYGGLTLGGPFLPNGQAGTTGQVLQSAGAFAPPTWNTFNGLASYQHSIFTPTTGGTVSLVNKQYNIINPGGALVALTVNLPSSPANNDVVYIKYTQTITTVTYGNGTVVDGITAPSAGGLVVLVYDSGTTSWY